MPTAAAAEFAGFARVEKAAMTLPNQVWAYNALRSNSALKLKEPSCEIRRHGRLCREKAKSEHTKDSLQTVKKNVAEGKAVIVDVREPKEWEAGHLKGAILMPSSQLKVEKDLSELVKKLDKDKIVYTHCRAGGRAATCAAILTKEGFDVRALKPGYKDLIEAGFEKATD
jgi:rhodanese-related sulfurtransferase